MAADRRSPLAFAVLATLAERPLHAYALFGVLQERGKAEIVAVPTRASLYPVLDRLGRAGLIAVHATERESRRPERTVYRVTPEGEAAARQWLLGYLASGSAERAGFTAALSFAMMASPGEVTEALGIRRSLLVEERARLLDGIAAGEGMGLPPLFQLDERYRLAILDTDLAVLDDIVGRLASGELTWDLAWIADVAQRLGHSTP